MSIKVVVVDDHVSIRDAIARFLVRRKFDVVGQAGTAIQAEEIVARVEPDVVIVDLGLASGSGLELIKSLSLHVRCLVFSGHESSTTLSQSMEAGAAGFVGKTRGLEELVDAIRLVAAGKTVVAGSFDRRLPQPDESLSQRERQVLVLVSLGHPSREVARRLNISPATVDTYRRRVYEKLELSSLSQLIRYSLDHGLI